MNSVSESLAGGTLLLIASDIPTDAELTEITSFWMWEPVRERWQYVCDWEEHEREAMRRFERWRPALVEAEETLRPLTRWIQ